MTTSDNSDQSRSILLVEDNLAHVRLIQEALKDSPFCSELFSVRNGIEAMAYLRQEEKYSNAKRPDIILLDLNLPCKDGREVLAEVKADALLKRIPVLVLTTSNSEEDICHSYDLHANAYITKSSDINQLFKMIHRIEEFWFDTAVLPPVA